MGSKFAASVLKYVLCAKAEPPLGSHYRLPLTLSSVLEILTRHVHTNQNTPSRNDSTQWRENLHSRNVILHFRIKNEQEKCGKPDPGNGQTRWNKVCVIF